MSQRLPLLPLVIRGSFATTALVAIVASPWIEPSVSRPSWVLPFALALIAIGATAGLYRAADAVGLGLGAMVFPVAIELVGPARAGLIAIAAVGVRDLILPRLPLSWMLRTRGRSALGGDWWVRTTQVALASVASAWAWLWLLPRIDSRATVPFAVAALSFVVFLGLQLFFEAVEEGFSVHWPSWGAATLLEALGWTVGCAVVVIGTSSGLPLAFALLCLVTVLSLDAVRLFSSRERIERELELLKDAAAVGRRGTSELRGTVANMLDECARVVSFHWFHFELFPEIEGTTSWRAGPDRQLFEGIPTPPSTPPMLPGIHRRSSWKVLEAMLTTDTAEFGRLRLWCDPRQLDGGEEQLFETLAPQFTSAVRTVLLEHQARHDSLTGLPGRRVLHQRLGDLFDQACNDGRPMAVLMCDIDHFKRVNDTLGHAAGDDALRHVADVFDSHRREGDLCSRYGGEEFVVSLEGTDPTTALRVAERFRKAVEKNPCVIDEKSVPLTISVGVSVFPEVYVSHPDELLELADQALYRAKALGRNCSLMNLGGGVCLDPAGKRHLEGPAVSPDAPRIFA